MQLAIHCAPFLKGIKESAVVSLPRDQAVEFSVLAARTGLSWYFLLHEDGKDMVFIYRKKELERLLQKEDVSAFLKNRGYLQSGKIHPFSICRILSELSRRVEAYYRTKENFPHEIGVLLGYPTEDVEGFIANEGRDCLCTGYWKVYQNEQRAKHIFAAFDEAREVTVREVLEGKELLQLCTSI
ncbi:DUF3793 family protein [Eisenbergiella tayi]|nr:DUF3793 family protein [Eisenbergiella tayi]